MCHYLLLFLRFAGQVNLMWLKLCYSHCHWTFVLPVKTWMEWVLSTVITKWSQASNHLFPFPVLHFSSFYDELPHYSLLLSPFFNSCIYLPSLAFLSFTNLRDVIKSSTFRQLNISELLNSLQILQPWQITHHQCILTLFCLYVVHPFTLPQLPFYLNSQMTLMINVES